MKKLFYIYTMLLCLPLCLTFFTDSQPEAETFVILGTKLNDDTIPPLLKHRLDMALSAAAHDTHFIVTGQHEAEAMAQYLIEHGIEKTRITVENQATTTYENLLFTSKLLPAQSFTIISNDFHIFRAQAIARSLGLDVQTLGADTPLIDRFYWQLRESLALLHFSIQRFL